MIPARSSLSRCFLRASALGIGLGVAGCGPTLYTSRVPAAPLLAKLTASGGDPSRILHPRSAADLAPLDAGHRYRFVVLGDGTLAVAPLPQDAQGNEYVHPVLAAGAPVLTAGFLHLERTGDELRAISVDQDSKSFCPPFASLAAARAALAALGVASDKIQLENHPPECIAKP